MKEYFNFTKNELIIYHYLYELGDGNYELRPCDFRKMGMAEQSFRDGRNGLEKKGYLIKIATNYYNFKKEKGEDNNG